MNGDMSISALRRGYADGSLTPAAVFSHLRQRVEEFVDRNIWIHLFDEVAIQNYLESLAEKDFDSSPLWGIPFAIKDNIDLAGVPTTAGCEAFAYTPDESAFVVARLLQAGAIPVGKTNLDQFATGLNGTRSPWGACHNSFDPQYISGGSSSGSAVAVALGLASFSLGTDTAGSGRVPAAFNNLVGVKPTCGLLSASGVVPACRSLDTISLFAFNTDDANVVLEVAEGFEPADDFSRQNPFANSGRHYAAAQAAPTVGVIPREQLQFFGDSGYQLAYTQTLAELAAGGVTLVEIDYSAFDEAARLLYEGPWVAERYLATLPLIEESPEAMFPVVREIIAAGREASALDAFRAQYRLMALRRRCEEQLASVDCLLTPTAGRLFTRDEMLAEPIRHNSQLGYYTNFMNLLDLSAVAVPTAFTDNGLPFGVTLAAGAFSDRRLLGYANFVQRLLPLPQGNTGAAQPQLRGAGATTPEHVEVVVCGAHMSGLPLNWQLVERGATCVSATQTASDYRLYALPGRAPMRPGLVRAASGAAIDVEVWRVPVSEFGSFVAAIPAPLGIGKVTLADGEDYSGFVCEQLALDGAVDITHLGGWRQYLATL